MAAFEITYSVDGVPFSSFGVIVTSSKGFYAKTEAKETLSADWEGHNGMIRDLSNIKYYGRSIELACAIEGNGYDQFTQRAKDFLAAFSGNEHYLERSVTGTSGSTKILVYMPNQLDISKTWDSRKTVGTFTLKLEELNPAVVYDRAYNTYTTPAEPTDNDVHYYIDGIDLRTINVHVASSKGIFCKPAQKDTLSVDWYGQNGIQKKLSNTRYQERTIELSCFIEGGNYISFMLYVQILYRLVAGSGTHRLRIKARGVKPLLYEVYHPSAVVVDPQWDAKKNIGTFTLKLVEPEPVKIVVSFSGDAIIKIKSRSVANIYWGDGTHTFDVSGSGNEVNVTHSMTGTHEAIITVETTDVDLLYTNGTIIWNRLV